MIDLSVESGRKLFHLLATVFPLFYYVAGRKWAAPIFAALAVAAVSVEISRLRFPRVQSSVMRVFGRIMRGIEERRVSGATYVLLGLAASALLFEPPIALSVMLMVTVSDAVAAIVGRRFGKPVLWGKSWAGSAAFFVTALVIVFLVPGVGFVPGVVGATSGTIVELLPLPVDDNLAVPVLAGGVIQMIS